MNRKLVTVAMTLALASGMGVAEAAPTYDPATDPAGNLIGLTTPNGRVAYDFIDLWFNQNKPAEAFDKYVARQGYLDHAVYAGTTETMNKTFEEEKAAAVKVMQMLGSAQFDTKQIVAQGELVFMHIAASKGKTPPAASSAAPAAGAQPPANVDRDAGIRGDHKGPREMIEILRVHNGKITDHWDLHVATSSDSIVFEALDRKLP